MHVREMRDGEEARWDDFVHSCEHSTPQHLSAWKKVMEQSFQSKMHYLLAEPQNRRFIGLANFAAVFKDDVFWLSLRNTGI